MLHQDFRYLNPLSTLFLVLIILGCASGTSITNPVDPEAESTVQGTPEEEGHYLWGEYVITIEDILDEQGNVIDVEMDIKPMRSSQIHVNVTSFVTPPSCGDCVTVQPVNVIPGPLETEITATVFLKNPTVLTGYDIRGIIYPEAWGARMETLDGTVTYDGLTSLYNLGMPQTVNPYMAFNKETQFRPFGANETHAVSYIFTKDNNYQLYQMAYKIDASWPDNAGEAVGCYVFPSIVGEDLYYPGGSNAWILVEIIDWQKDIASVTLDFSEFGISTPGEMLMYDEDEANYLTYWQYHVTEPAGSPVGIRSIRMSVDDSVEQKDYMFDIKVEVTNDGDPPKWADSGCVSIYDHVSFPAGLWLFYCEAWDISLPLQYLFYGNDQSSPFDGDLFKVETQATYTGYTVFGSGPDGGAPDNEMRWFGIRLQDEPGYQDDNMVEYICTRYSEEQRWLFIKDQNPGQGGILGSPAIGDVNGDGVDDIVVGARNHKVYAYGGSGTGTQNTIIWEFETGHEVQNTPALVDLNDDGKLDVVIASDDKFIYALNGATGLPIWAYDADTGDDMLMHGSPSIAYINGDDVPDVVIGTGLGDVLALNGAGPTDPGDPESIVIWRYTDPANPIAGTPAVADVTGDGIADVAIGSYDSRMHMINGATGVKIWDYYVGSGLYNISCSPVLVDINGDDVPDCIFGAREGSGFGGALFAIDGTSTQGNVSELWIQNHIWGNPKQGPAPAQINDDGVWDFIVCAYQTEQYSYNAISGADGSIIYQYMRDDINPDNPFNYSSPIVGDFTGDGHVNFLYGRKDGYVDIINLDSFGLPSEWAGRHLHTIMCAASSNPEITGTPAVGDVDGDGELELIACDMRGYTYIHDLHAPVPSDVSLFSWTQHSGNRWNTGTPEFVPPE